LMCVLFFIEGVAQSFTNLGKSTIFDSSLQDQMTIYSWN
jgi:hypothetical protein